MVDEENKRRFIRISGDVETSFTIISSPDQERRRFMRIMEDDAVRYAVVPKYKSIHSLSRDLSIGGIRFYCDGFIQPHSILKVEIKLKHVPRVVNVIVKVVWVREIFDDERYEIGAEFLEINKEDLKFLDYYLGQTTK